MRIWGFIVVVFVLQPAVAQGAMQRFGIVLGNNLGHDASRQLRFAERDARKMFSVLSELGGFSKENLVLMLGANATEVRGALFELQQKMAALAHVPSQRSLFFFFYSGHAEGDVFELGQTSFRFDEVNQVLKDAKADIRIGVIDACRSGRILASKGGRRGPSYAIQVTDEMTSSGYAIVTSSSENELSQESKEIRGSFFTHFWVSALRGAGDKTKDGRVTLAEAYSFAYSKTVAKTSTTIGGSQHPMYEFKLEGQGEVVLTAPQKSTTKLEITADRDGRLLVLDQHGEHMIAEAHVTGGRTGQMALTPGQYIVYLVAPQKTKRATLSLKSGETVRLSAGNFATHQLDRTVSKGGLFREAREHELTGFLLVRRMPLQTADVNLGAGLTYRTGQSDQDLAKIARLIWTSAQNTDVSGGYFDLGAYGGIGRVWQMNAVTFRVEGLLGYEHLFQKASSGERLDTSSFACTFLVGLVFPLGSVQMELSAGGGVRMYQTQQEGWVNRLDYQVLLGVGDTFTF